MKELFFTREQKQILDIQRLYGDRGVCNIGGFLTETNVQNVEPYIEAIRMAIMCSPVYHIQTDAAGKPYMSQTPVLVKAWNCREEPGEQQLNEWMGKSLFYPDSTLYELRYWKGSGKLNIYLKIHHILADSYSIVLMAKRYEYYKSLILQAGDPEQILDDSYICRMHAAEVNSDKEDNWLRQVVPDQMPEKWTIKRTKSNEINAEVRTYWIPNPVHDRLVHFSKVNRISVESIFYGVISVYCHLLTGSPKVCLGRSMLNRRKNEMDMAGVRVNQMPVFIDIADNIDFVGQCREIMHVLYDMMRFSGASFSEYLREHNISNNFYDTAISYRNERMLPGQQEVSVQELFSVYLELPLRIHVSDSSEGIRVDIQYQTANYTDKGIEALYERFMCILLQGMENKKVGNISALSDRDKRLWSSLNKYASVKLPLKTILESIHDFVGRNDLIAVSYKGRTLTYEQLWRASCEIKKWLTDRRVCQDGFVAVQLEVSELLPAVFIGVWMAGAAFIPVAVNESAERMAEISDICGAVITYKDVDGVLHKECMVCGGENRFETERGGAELQNDIYSVNPDGVAYGMFTSGSTGKPKLALISHRSLSWRVMWMIHRYGNPGTVLQKTAYTFDVSMWEFFLPLVSGNRLCLMQNSERADPRRIAEALNAEKIETVHFVPSVLSIFLTYVESRKMAFPYLHNVYASGEALSAELSRSFARLLPGVGFHNLYGPTECTIDVTYYDCTGCETEVPIGVPLPGVTVSITDDSGRCLPAGEEGFLVVGGALVGMGYYGEVQGGYFIKDGERRYNTGDRAVLGYDGRLYYRGRNDRQCKIHGMRVNPEQIEDALMSVQTVSRAAVLCDGEQLAAFYMSDKPVDDMPAKLGIRLAAYSIPSGIYWIKEIPTTSHGKTDYECLREMLDNRRKRQKGKEAKSPEEAVIVDAIWKVAGIKVTVDENIFSAGVDSLRLIEILLELSSGGYEYTPEEFYQNKTVECIVGGRDLGAQWLCRTGKSKALIVFPYAAGMAEAFVPLSDVLRDYDVDVIVTRKDDVTDIAEAYERVVLLGYCTGTANAIRACERLSHSRNIEGVVLCAALPPGIRSGGGSPWKKLGDKGIARLLRYLHREKINVTEGMIKMFRNDTDRFFEFFKQNHIADACRVQYVFGAGDILTLGARCKWKRWEKYIKGSSSVRIFPGEHHFFIKSRCAEIAGIVREML